MLIRQKSVTPVIKVFSDVWSEKRILKETFDWSPISLATLFAIDLAAIFLVEYALLSLVYLDLSLSKF